MPALKNNRHELFAQQLAQGKKADQAYVFAGFKQNRHNAANLGRQKHILTRISELQAPALRKIEVTVERLAEELGHISFHDLSDVLETRGSKVFLRKKLSELPKSVTAAIASVRATKEGIEVKFHDKLGAISLLGKHKGMFKENIDLKSGETSLADLVIASYEKGKASVAKDKPAEKPKDKG